MYFYNGAPSWVFSMFAFIAVVLSLIPLPWHMKGWNVGATMFMLWTALANLVFFIDSIVWNGNVIDWSPTWCDISTHFLSGFNLAIPAASLCINRRLFLIATTRRSPTYLKTRAEHRRGIIVDFAIALGLPILQIPLQYIVQGHRYNIFEDVGCVGETYETPVAIILYHLPPILVGCASAFYCTRSIYAFHRSRTYFKEVLSANSELNLNTYVRLMCLAATDLLLTIPLGIWVLYSNVREGGLNPWISWADTHSNFSRVVQVPGIVWRSDVTAASVLESTRWITVGCAFIFFAYFGFAEEAVRNYRAAYTSVARRCGYCGGVLPTLTDSFASTMEFASGAPRSTAAAGGEYDPDEEDKSEASSVRSASHKLALDLAETSTASSFKLDGTRSTGSEVKPEMSSPVSPVSVYGASLPPHARADRPIPAADIV